jgi:hypothetical protein
MIRLKTYENFRKKKSEKVRKIEYPSAQDPYWKWIFHLNTENVNYEGKKHIEINGKLLTEFELIMKYSHYIFPNFVFDGVWNCKFDFSSLGFSDDTYATKQAIANVGDTSKQFEIPIGQWPYMASTFPSELITRATPEEIKFYELHSAINKYNL